MPPSAIRRSSTPPVIPNGPFRTTTSWRSAPTHLGRIPERSRNNMSSIPIPEPTLSTRAMLCSLSISQWSASKHDPQASQEIAAHHGAQPDVGRYNKLLIPKENLAELQRIAGEARREHYFMTLPWDDNGYRVLPAAVYMEHTEKLRRYGQEFLSAVELFAAQFDRLVLESRARLGGLFRVEDYPTSKEIRDKFSFDVKVMPLPDA